MSFLGFNLGPLPYYHQRVWLTDGWEYAIVELVEWQKETEYDLHVTLHYFKWWLKEKSDIACREAMTGLCCEHSFLLSSYAYSRDGSLMA